MATTSERISFWQSRSHRKTIKNENERNVNKETVVEFGEERSEARKHLTDCKKYNPPGIRGIDEIKWYVWSKTERAERK